MNDLFMFFSVALVALIALSAILTYSEVWRANLKAGKLKKSPGRVDNSDLNGLIVRQ